MDHPNRVRLVITCPKCFANVVRESDEVEWDVAREKAGEIEVGYFCPYCKTDQTVVAGNEGVVPDGGTRHDAQEGNNG